MPVVYDSKTPDGRDIGGVNPVTTQSTTVLAIDKDAPRTKTCKECWRTLPIGNFQNYGRNARVCADCRESHQQPHNAYKQATATKRKVPKKPEPAPKEEHPQEPTHPLVELVEQALANGLTVEVVIR